MLLTKNFHTYIYVHKTGGKNLILMAYLCVKMDVCGSLVLSNPVTLKRLKYSNRSVSLELFIKIGDYCNRVF